jgi:hypothetical protein
VIVAVEAQLLVVSCDMILERGQANGMPCSNHMWFHMAHKEGSHSVLTSDYIQVAAVVVVVVAVCMERSMIRLSIVNVGNAGSQLQQNDVTKPCLASPIADFEGQKVLLRGFPERLCSTDVFFNLRLTLTGCWQLP